MAGTPTPASGPTVTPQVAPSPTSGGLVQQLANQLAGAGSGSGTSKDLYGLGNWAAQQVDPSGFTGQVALLLQQAGIDTSKPMTAAQLVQAIAQSNNIALIAQLQQMLWYSGAYGTAVKSFTDLQPGVVGQQDIKALTNVVTLAGQTATPLGTYLTTSANYGKANGILGAISGAVNNPVALPAPSDEDAVLKAQAQTLFGHDPSPDEYARFQAFYNQKVLGEAKAEAAAQNPTLPAGLPDASTLGQAITNSDQPAPAKMLSERYFDPDTKRMVVQQAPNPTYATWEEQQQTSGSALGAVNQAAQSIDANGPNVSTYTQAPDMSGAAQEFLQQDNPGQVAAQNVASKYATLLSILSGSGS